MKLKIKKLVSENSFLMDEQKIAQENLRLSNAQQQKILNEYNEYKGVIMQNQLENEKIRKKMQMITKENEQLTEELQNNQ